MRATILAFPVTLAAALAAVPAGAQQLPAKGQEAVTIVEGGQIRAASSEGFQGFLLLIEYNGTSYTCTVTAVGQVQACYPLRW